MSRETARIREIIGADFHACLFRNYIFVKGLSLQSKIFNIPRWDLCITSKKNAINYISDPATADAARNAVKSKVQTDINFIHSLIDSTNQIGEEFNAWSETEIYQKNLSSVSNQHLIQLYHEFVEKQSHIYAYGVLLPLIDFHDFAFVEDNLKKILKAHYPEGKFQEYFNCFTYPLYHSYAQDQEEALLSLMNKYYTREWKNQVLTSSLKDITKRYPHFVAGLEQHTKKYCWVYYVFTGPAFSMEQFYDFVKVHCRSAMPPAEMLKQMRKKKADIEKKRVDLIKSFHGSPFERMILALAPKIVWAKPRRKDLQSKSYYHVEKLQKEIAKRLYLSLNQVRALPPNEVEKAFLGKIDLKYLYSLYQHHVCTADDEGIIHVLNESQAQQFMQSVKSQPISQQSGEILGTCSCPGKAQGKVRIINLPEDMEKMDYGDVLVSLATNPSLVPAMKKASAIITDEGGLTCHAAIVSRELNIPCITGAKVATQLLKDGDEVEVDATQGKVIKATTEGKRLSDIHRETNIVPLMQMLNFGYPSKETGDLLGIKPIFFVGAYQKETVTLYCDSTYWTEVGEKIITMIQHDPRFFKNLLKKSNFLCEKALKILVNSTPEKMEKMREKEMTGNIKTLCHCAFLLSVYSQVGTIADHHHNKFSNLLHHIITEAKKRASTDENSGEILSLLTTPTVKFPSEQAKEHYCLLKKRKGGLNKRKKETDSLLSQWYFLHHGQTGPGLTSAQIREEWEQQHDQKKKHLQQRQRKIMHQLKLTKQEQDIFEIARTFVYLKGMRAEICDGVWAVLHLILKKIEKKTGTKTLYLRYCSIQELLDHQENSAPLPGLKELEARREYSIWIPTDYLNTSILVGEEARNYIKKNIVAEKEQVMYSNEIKGNVAFAGYAKGKVKIVNTPEDMKKMETGDIMVSIQTMPELLPAMKMAAAFVTDIGGITSHAAITSREMKKPCIIGTKVATKFLKDGNLVEVDADNGILKVIS